MGLLLPGVFAPLGSFQVNPLGGAAQTLAQLAATASFTVPKGYQFALIQVEGADVRWRDDGVAPTATVGVLMPSNSEPIGVSGAQAKAMQFIQTAAGAATINVSLYG